MSKSFHSKASLTTANVAGIDASCRTAVDLVTTLGGMILDPDLGGPRERRFAARVPLTVLGELGVAPNATRLALSRLVQRDLLSTTKVGRVAVYTISDAAVRVFSDAGIRMLGTDPLASTSAVWTLVSFSVPETRRELRNRLRVHLAQCGFRLLRDGLWVALEPFAADRVTRDLGADLAEHAELDIFVGTPYLSNGLADLVRRGWDLDDLRTRHQQFLARWEHAEPAADHALPALLSLTADWVDLLQHDPGLPTDSLEKDWPGARSAVTAARLRGALREPAGLALARLLAASEPRTSQ